MLLHFSIEGQCQASCDAQPAERQNKLEAQVANSCRSLAQKRQHTVAMPHTEMRKKKVKEFRKVACLRSLWVGKQAKRGESFILLFYCGFFSRGPVNCIAFRIVFHILRTGTSSLGGGQY